MILQEFLNKSIVTISEDGNFEKLKKASDDLAKKIGKDKAKITSYSLAAIDPQISAIDGAIVEVQEIIVKHWTTFVSNSKDSHLTIIRAVILEALETVAKDQNNSSLIWNATRNVIKYYNLDREKELIVAFLKQLGNDIEKSAVDSWALPSEANLEKLKVELQQITGTTISRSVLQKKLEDASGPSNSAGVANYESPNPHWPNSGANWSYQFPQRAADGIADVVNKALKDQASALTDNQTKVQEAVNKLLTKTQNEILQKNTLLQMRTHLLWWKEACYSPSLKKSYRGTENGLLELSLASDYATFVPHIYPASTDFFLLEFHKTLTTDSKIKLATLLENIRQQTAVLKDFFTEPTIDTSRNTLLNFIKGLVWGKCNVADTKALTGVSEEIEINYSEFILWMFHDAQAFKITQIK